MDFFPLPFQAHLVPQALECSHVEGDSSLLYPLILGDEHQGVVYEHCTCVLMLLFFLPYHSYAACCDFLQHNNLLSIIRAHEAQDAG